MKGASRSSLRAWVPAALWACVILILTSVPGDQLGLVEDIEVSSRWAHVALYFPLGMLVFGALSSSRPDLSPSRCAVLAFVICAAFGVLDELHQLFIPGRYCDVGDMVADALGAAAGVGIAVLLMHVRARRDISGEAKGL